LRTAALTDPDGLVSSGQWITIAIRRR
jgi:hypothetical protein